MQTIYYVPGRGGRLDQGLGVELSARGFDLIGREISRHGSREKTNPFASLHFVQQIEVIQHDLKSHAWKEDALVIGNSFGAYLISHAILQLGEYPGKCLFTSPVLGTVRTNGFYFRPPKAHALRDAIESESFPKIYLDVLVGQDDEHYLSEVTEKLGNLTVGKILVVANEGHRLQHETVKAKLNEWLPPPT